MTTLQTGTLFNYKYLIFLELNVYEEDARVMIFESFLICYKKKKY